MALEPVIAPPLPDSIEASALDAQARRDLRGLAKDVAEAVARHLVAAGVLVDDDPARALDHARYARRRASRIAVVREAAGITAYHAGEWAEALADLRAARRMGGGPGHLAVMADIERALGRPERAIEVARGPEAAELDRAAQIELVMVVAGARRDLGELDASVVGLQIPELDPARRDPWSARLFYAYADNLLAVGRESDAVQWFVHAVDADESGETDAAYRLADLTGEPPPDDDGIDFDVEDVVEATGNAPAASRTTTTAASGRPDVVEDGVGPAADRGAEIDAAPDAEVDAASGDTTVPMVGDATALVVGDAVAEVPGSDDPVAGAAAPASTHVVSTRIAPTDAVPTDAVPTDAVPTDAASTDAAAPVVSVNRDHPADRAVDVAPPDGAAPVPTADDTRSVRPASGAAEVGGVAGR